METVADITRTSVQGSTEQPEVGIALGEEYRRDERYPVNGDAEVVVLGGTSLFRGRIMDISVSGCYIQTLAWVRLKPETPVEILFAVDGKVVRALGASRYVKSKVGIGFRFLKMNEEMQRKLDELIDDARTRFMELTRQTKGQQPVAGAAAPLATPPLLVDPAALQVVAVREQERAASAPGAKPSSNQRPASVAVVNQSPASFSPVVEEAAVAVASLEQEAAGVQASQMLEVSVLSKLEQPDDRSLDSSPAAVVEDDTEAEIQTQASISVTPISVTPTFEVDEDASDVGHAEIWSASTGMAQWQPIPMLAHPPAGNIEMEIAPTDLISAEPVIVHESELVVQQDLGTAHPLHSESEVSACDAMEEMLHEDPLFMESPVESLPAMTDEPPVEAQAEPTEAEISPIFLEAEGYNEGDSTPYAQRGNNHAGGSAELQQFEELIHLQTSRPDERAQGSDGQFAVFGD